MFALAAVPACGQQPPSNPPLTIELRQSDGQQQLVLSGLDADQRGACQRLIDEAAQSGDWRGMQQVFSLRKSDSDDTFPAIIGQYEILDQQLLFRPRLALGRGIALRATFYPAQLGIERQPVHLDFEIPELAGPAAMVTAVYPTDDILPENLLRFYVHFSGPMQRGDVYRFVRLRHAKGEDVELPFLEIDQELWSRDGLRLTLLLDPGRIKRGLRPREEFGPILEQGKFFELVIDGRWPDARGNPLGQDFVKAFRAGPVDEQQPDPHNWSYQLPAADSDQPLTIRFNEPLDHAMIQRVIGVEDPAGQQLEGRIDVGARELQWQFHPTRRWRPGVHQIVVSSELEDRAGNSIRRQFDVDVFERTESSGAAKLVRIPVEIVAPQPDRQ